MSRSTTPARATPARAATPRRSAPTASRCFAPVRANRARRFCRGCAVERRLQALGVTGLKVAPDPVLIASEGALWGAIRHQGLLPDTVIVSDDAGQFRVGVHALCWVHA